MSAGTTSPPQTHSPERKGYIIHNDQEILESGDFKMIREGLHGAAGEVHVTFKTGDHDDLPTPGNFRGVGIQKFFPCEFPVFFRGDVFDQAAADIMPCLNISLARIPEPYDDLH